MYNLKDTYLVTGTEKEKFLETIKEMEDATQNVQVDLGYAKLYQRIGSGGEDLESFAELNKDSANIFNETGSLNPKTVTVNKKGLPEEIAKEIDIATRMISFAEIEGQCIFGENASHQAATIVRKEGLIDMPMNMTSALALVSELLKNKKTATAICRKNAEGWVKVFGLASKGYCHIPQVLIKDVLDSLEEHPDMKKGKVVNWSVDQHFSKIYVEYPEAGEEFRATYDLKENVTPGFILETGDTGMCSFKVVGTFRIGSSRPYVIPRNTYSRRHYGAPTKKDIIEGVEKNVFREFFKLPEALAKAVTISITPYGCDLTSPIGKANNEEAYGKVVNALLKPFKECKYITKETFDVLSNKLLDIDESEPISLYDVYIKFLTVLEHGVKPSSPTEERWLNQLISDVPYKIPKGVIEE